MRSFAFFDLDHTLLPFDTQLLFCNFVLRHERWRTLAHLSFAPVALLKTLRLVRTVTAKRAFMNYLAGMSRDGLAARAMEFAERIVKPSVYPELLEEMARHRSAGRILVLNSASADFYVGAISRLLGFHYFIATRVEIPAKMPLMPRITGENNKRGVKIERMRAEIPEFAVANDEVLRDSWSYSDSLADLPLLELAGHAVLVHPDASLEAIGKERGWTVLLPQRPYANKAGDMICVVRQALGLWKEPA